MENVIIVLILVAAVGYGIYSFIHHLRHGGGCCGEHDAPAKKVRAADTNKSHYPRRSSARPSATQATCRCARRKRCDFSGTPSLYRTM